MNRTEILLTADKYMDTDETVLEMMTAGNLVAFARAIAAKERETCAAIVDAETDEWESKDICAILRDVAAEIRERGEDVEEPPSSPTDVVESELVAWMFQHEETGLTECVDAQQVEWGFEKNNPRWKKIHPLYTAPPKREWVGLAGEEIGAWQVMVEDEAMKEFPIKDMANDWCVYQKLSGAPYDYWIRPLYTAPPKREWVGLTMEDVAELRRGGAYTLSDRDAFAVDAKLREKNHEIKSYKDLCGND